MTVHSYGRCIFLSFLEKKSITFRLGIKTHTFKIRYFELKCFIDPYQIVFMIYTIFLRILFLN